MANERTGVRHTAISDISRPWEIGYPSGRKDINNVYMIKIRSSSSNVLIRALIQDKVSLRVTSEWVPFSSSNWLSRKVQEVFQLVTTRALYPRFSTRRIWHGTSPMALSLPLKFEAEEDPDKEVVQPCKELQRMVLPQQFTGNVVEEGVWEKIKGTLTVHPPGPSPYSFDWFSSEATPGIYKGAGDIISIKIGNFLVFRPVIIREVTVEFANKFTREGLPISATATIQFETFEMLTKELLDTEVYINEEEVIPLPEPAASITSKDIYGVTSSGTMRA